MPSKNIVSRVITKSAARRNMEERNKMEHRILMNRVMKNLQTLKKVEAEGAARRAHENGVNNKTDTEVRLAHRIFPPLHTDDHPL